MEVRRFMLLSAALQLFPRLAFCKPRWIPSWVHCRQPEAGPQGQILKWSLASSCCAAIRYWNPRKPCPNCVLRALQHPYMLQFLFSKWRFSLNSQLVQKWLQAGALCARSFRIHAGRLLYSENGWRIMIYSFLIHEHSNLQSTNQTPFPVIFMAHI